VHCNHDWLGRAKVRKKSGDIHEMLNLVNIDDVGFGNMPINVPKKISTWVIQSTNDLPTTLSRLFLLITDPRAPDNTGSTMCCVRISDVLNN